MNLKIQEEALHRQFFPLFLAVNTVEFQPFSKIPVKSHISLLIPAIVLWSEL